MVTHVCLGVTKSMQETMQDRDIGSWVSPRFISIEGRSRLAIPILNLFPIVIPLAAVLLVFLLVNEAAPPQLYIRRHSRLKEKLRRR
jgi:hypothetical protein